ncbi:hypothetical protein [Aeoliella sp.]|uniref:hypothetical protein n=1 Tax=Aeoliella sp. TaxID=2795800 RepID=UPI003CCBAA95
MASGNRRPRTWGFRLSKSDVAVLLVTVALTALFWNATAGYTFLGLLVVLHFFLFCNIFRIPRKPELIWAACFVAICVACVLLNRMTPLNVTLAVLPVTLAILLWSIRLPTYHGIFAKRINPRLDDYLAARVP